MRRAAAFPLLAAVALAPAAYIHVAKVDAKIRVGYNPCGLTYAFGSIWVVNHAATTLAKVSPVTNRTVRRTSIEYGSCGVVGFRGYLWIEGYRTNDIQQVDPRSGNTVKRIRVGNLPWDVAAGGGAIWASNSVDGTVSRNRAGHGEGGEDHPDRR